MKMVAEMLIDIDNGVNIVAEHLASMDLKYMREVRIYIDSAYKWGRGMTQEVMQAFHDESRAFVYDMGWDINIGDSWRSDEATTKDSYLYLHPMEFTGYMPEDDIDAFVAGLEDAETFKVRSVNRGRRVFAEKAENVLNEFMDVAKAYIKANYKEQRLQSVYFYEDGKTSIAPDCFYNAFQVLTVDDMGLCKSTGDAVSNFFNNAVAELIKEKAVKIGKRHRLIKG